MGDSGDETDVKYVIAWVAVCSYGPTWNVDGIRGWRLLGQLGCKWKKHGVLLSWLPQSQGLPKVGCILPPEFGWSGPLRSNHCLVQSPFDLF